MFCFSSLLLICLTSTRDLDFNLWIRLAATGFTFLLFVDFLICMNHLLAVKLFIYNLSYLQVCPWFLWNSGLQWRKWGVWDRHEWWRRCWGQWACWGWNLKSYLLYCILLIINVWCISKDSHLYFLKMLLKKSTNSRNVNPVAADLIHRLKSKSRVEGQIGKTKYRSWENGF